MAFTDAARRDVIFYDLNDFSDKKKTKSSKLPIKEYATRNSLLTDLYENKHISTTYHFFLTILFTLYSAAYDYFYRGRIRLGLDVIIKGFPNIHFAILVWIGMFLSSFTPYYGLAGWAIGRIRLGGKSIARQLWDSSALAMIILYYVVFLAGFPMVMKYLNFKLGESIALLCEAVRLVMKSHAFVRSNAPRVLAYKLQVEDQVLHPTFQQFIYFSFIPATVYQDEYPRTKKTNWSNVIVHLIELIVCGFLLSYVVEIFYVNAFDEFGTREYQSRELTMLLLINGFGGFLILIIPFYAILHIWMNVFAEIFRFSDRMFYKDWWTSDNAQRYHRTWNVVVHDWLYTYVYKDLYEVVIPKNKFLSKTLVFFLSAVFHEYILALGFGFFFPIMFIFLFMLGIPCDFIKFKFNFLLWVSIFLGTSVQTSFWAMEYYCRANAYPINSNWKDVFVPKFLNCL